MPTTIRLMVTLQALPGKVFAALCHPRAISEWSGQKGNVQLKVGGRMQMFDGWITGRVLEYRPGKNLTYTWITKDWEEKTTPSIVTYVFSKTKTGTRVDLTHKNLPNREEARKHREGWKTYVFDPLKEYLKRKSAR